MTLTESVKTCFRKYFTFSGRASRSEFWWFALFLSIISTGIQSYVSSDSQNLSFKFGLHFNIGTHAHLLENLFTAATFVPFIAALTRRLHDTGTSGWRALIYLAILATAVGSLWVLPWQISFIFIVFLMAFGVYSLCKKSRSGSNQYGPNPHEVTP
ncbi:DUF805 domain-containing protein [uncultured Roseobacter sp.]|uniref:DUF805 domain-containing protein n=1 Tax=uncultured Roseobacter sp. TaxID=114847 RepID=UPI0026062E19|nr:DUF805 domain-containing protein [uncultured Roseobacter sp.]